MVDAQPAFIRVIPLGFCRSECVGPIIGQREEAQQVLSKRTDTDGTKGRQKWQLVVGNRKRRVDEPDAKLVGWIVTQAGGESLRTELRKIPGPLFQGGHSGTRRFALAVAEALIEGKEERLILANRPANGGSELVLLQGFDGVREVVGSVKRVIAYEFPKRAMEVVGTRLGDDVGGGAEAVAEFSGGVVG